MKTILGIFSLVCTTLPATLLAEELRSPSILPIEGKSYVIVVGVQYAKKVKWVKRQKIEITLMEKFGLKNSSMPGPDHSHMCTYKAKNAMYKWLLKRRIRGFDLRHASIRIHISKYASMYY